MPVLPEVESRRVTPGPRRPSAIAARRMARAGRSLILPPGLVHSAFSQSSTCSGRPARAARLRSGRRGVLPIAATAATLARPARRSVASGERCGAPGGARATATGSGAGSGNGAGKVAAVMRHPGWANGRAATRHRPLTGY
jgi:hypothetical protein